MSELAEQSTPVASTLSDSFGLVQNLSFVDLDQPGEPGDHQRIHVPMMGFSMQ